MSWHFATTIERIKNALDAIGIADRNLDMAFAMEAAAGVKSPAFYEHAPYRVERPDALIMLCKLINGGVQMPQNRAIEKAEQPILVLCARRVAVLGYRQA